jgi:hypothetical protein
MSTGTSTEATAVLVAQDLDDKYIAVDGLDLPDAVRTPLVGLLGADAPPTTVALTAFRGAQTFVHGRLKDEQFVKFATSPQYSQYCISILSSGTVRVEDMLYSEPFRAEFMDYMIREDCASIMNFWIIASEFQISVTAKEPDGKLKNDEKTMMGDARGISSRYAGPDAMEPIGLDEVVLSDMDKRLKAGKVSNCFVRALHTVYVAVGSFFFLEYLQSPAFQQYLKGGGSAWPHPLVLCPSVRLLAGRTPSPSSKGGFATTRYPNQLTRSPRCTQACIASPTQKQRPNPPRRGSRWAQRERGTIL